MPAKRSIRDYNFGLKSSYENCVQLPIVQNCLEVDQSFKQLGDRTTICFSVFSLLPYEVQVRE